jgi:hypothetical protein
LFISLEIGDSSSLDPSLFEIDPSLFLRFYLMLV